MNTKLVRLMALVAAVGFTACGESTDIVPGELTEAEATDLAGVVLFATFNSTGAVPQPTPSAGGPQMTPFTFASEFEGEVPCAFGGVVGIAASFEVSGDTENEAGHVEYSMTQTPVACAVDSQEGRRFILWGNPNLSVAFSVDNDGAGVSEWGGSIQGTIDWQTDGREGSCTIAVEFSGRQEGEANVTANVGGTVCNMSVQHSLTVG